MFGRVLLLSLSFLAAIGCIFAPAFAQSILPTGNSASQEKEANLQKSPLWRRGGNFVTRSPSDVRTPVKFVARLSGGLILDYDPPVTRGGPGSSSCGMVGHRYYSKRPPTRPGMDSDPLRRQLPDTWVPPKDAGDAAIRFSMSKSGELQKIWIERSSGQEGADEAAIEALKNAAPMKGLSYFSSEFRALFSPNPRKSITIEILQQPPSRSDLE